MSLLLEEMSRSFDGVDMTVSDLAAMLGDTDTLTLCNTLADRTKITPLLICALADCVMVSRKQLCGEAYDEFDWGGFEAEYGGFVANCRLYECGHVRDYQCPFRSKSDAWDIRPDGCPVIANRSRSGASRG